MCEPLVSQGVRTAPFSRSPTVPSRLTNLGPPHYSLCMSGWGPQSILKAHHLRMTGMVMTKFTAKVPGAVARIIFEMRSNRKALRY